MRSIDPYMILVFSLYIPTMLLLNGSEVSPTRVRGLTFTPKSGIRGETGARREGFWAEYAFWGGARGRNADTSPAWSVRTSNSGADGAELSLWRGDDGVGLEREIYPAVARLPRADENLRAGRRHAIPVNVELRDMAVAPFRGGQAAQHDVVVNERHPRAARGRAEHHNVRGRSRGDTELELGHAAGVGGQQLAHRVGGEGVGLGPGQDGRETLCGQSRVDFDEYQIRRQAAVLASAGAAADVVEIAGPGGLLLWAKRSPHAPNTTEAGLVEKLGRARSLSHYRATAPNLSIPSPHADKVRAGPGLGDVMYLHINCGEGGVRGPERVCAPVPGNQCSTRA